MNVSLSPKTEKLLQERMSEGGYASPDEAIQIALETMQSGFYGSLDGDARAATERAEDLKLPLLESHKQELERRMAAADADPDAAVPWDQVKARLRGHS